MKKLLALSIVVAAALLGWPGMLGKTVQEEIETQLELVRGNPMLNVSISDYDRGWFSSKVRYEIGFTEQYLEMIEGAVKSQDENNNPLDESLLEILSPFELVSDISHGPVGVLNGPFFGLFKSLTTEGANNPQLNDFLAAANMPFLVKVSSTTGLLGDTTFSVDVPASQGAGDGAAGDSLASNLKFSGATASGRYSATGSRGARLRLTGRMENLSIIDHASEFTVDAVQMAVDSENIAERIWIGPVNTSIGAVTVRDSSTAEPIEMTAQDMLIDIDSGYGSSTDTLDVSMTYSIGQIALAGQSVSDIEFSMAMTELSVKAFERYNQWMQDPAFTQARKPNANQGEFAGLLPMLHEFIGKSPTISVNPLTFTTSNETLLANVTLNINGSDLPELSSFDAADAGLWLPRLSGKAGLSLSDSMALLLAVSGAQSQLQATLGDQQEITPQQISQMAAAQAPIMIQTLVQQGLLLRAGGQISAGIVLENGELQLNDQPLPLNEILGL